MCVLVREPYVHSGGGSRAQFVAVAVFIGGR